MARRALFPPLLLASLDIVRPAHLPKAVHGVQVHETPLIGARWSGRKKALDEALKASVVARGIVVSTGCGRAKKTTDLVPMVVVGGKE